MKTLFRQLSMIVLLVGFSITNALAASNASQSAFHHYCNGPELEFEQQVQVGSGRRVLVNHAAFPYIEQAGQFQASAAFIEKQMVAAGVQANCAEYLLSHAKSWQAGSQETLARVYFSFDSAELTSASRYLLDQLLVSLKDNPTLIVEGHTDNTGSDAYNFALGLRRAASVEAYLQQSAQTPLQLQSVSYGEARPIASNANEADRAQNRRVEIK